MDSPSGSTLQRTASSCQPEGASVTSAASPRLCSGRLKICLLALVLLQTVIIISASHNSTLLDVAAIFSPEEAAPNEEWTPRWGVSGSGVMAFYSVMAARDVSGETCQRCHRDLLPNEASITQCRRAWTGDHWAGSGHRPNRDVRGPRPTKNWPLATRNLLFVSISSKCFLAYRPCFPSSPTFPVLWFQCLGGWSGHWRRVHSSSSLPLDFCCTFSPWVSDYFDISDLFFSQSFISIGAPYVLLLKGLLASAHPLVVGHAFPQKCGSPVFCCRAYVFFFY